MPRIWIEGVLLWAMMAVSGCAAHRTPVLPHGERTMLDIWQSQTAGLGPTNARLLEARQALRRPLTEKDQQPQGAISYTRGAWSEIHRQFRRLPNPDLVMFVFRI